MRLEHSTGRFYLGRHYSEAVKAAGGTPLHIPLIPDPEYLSEVAGCIDGLLLPGSDSDIDPELYGEQPHPKLGAVVPERDATDLFLLAEAETRRLPVLAICFGLQSLNVSRGGTLIQDIVSQVPGAIKHQQGIPVERQSHSIRVEAESFLEKALAVEGAKAKVNSHHHQAIAKIGKDLRVTAAAADGVIEAVEDTRSDRYAAGYQWHPELGWENDVLSREIFRSFIEACTEKMRAGIAGS